jgi:hypothetical protein
MPFAAVLSEIIQKREINVSDLRTAVDPLLQDLILVNFCMAIGVWYKPLGKIINNALKN